MINYQILPRKNKDTDWSYCWIPIVGPFIGAAVAAGIFMLLDLPEANYLATLTERVSLMTVTFT